MSGNGSTIATPGIIVAMMALGRLLLLWGADIGLQAAAAGYDMASHIHLPMCRAACSAMSVVLLCRSMQTAMLSTRACHMSYSVTSAGPLWQIFTSPCGMRAEL